MLKPTEVKRYCVDTETGSSDFGIEPENDTFITTKYSVPSGALKCWILDHMEILLRDSAFKALVYQNVIKIFSGEESDWQVSRIDLFPDEVRITIENGVLEYMYDDEIAERHLQQLGMDFHDSKLDPDSPDFDNELLVDVMGESDDEYQRRITQIYPEISDCIENVASIVQLKFIGPTYISLTEQKRQYNNVNQRNIEIEYQINLQPNKTCRITTWRQGDSLYGRNGKICESLLYWDNSARQTMCGKVSYNHAILWEM